MHRVRQFWALTRLTLLEALRQPICLLLAVTGLELTMAMPLLFMHNFGEDGKMARDTGFALHLVFGLLIAAYASASTLAREIRTGTVLAVLSKPVGRPLFFLAKFTGIAALVMIFSAGAGLATLLSERCAEHFHDSRELLGYFVDRQTGFLAMGGPLVALAIAGVLNYRYRRPFESAAFLLMMVSLAVVFLFAGLFDVDGAWSPYDLRVQWRIVPVSLLIAMALVVFSALAVALSTRLQVVPTLAVCAGVLLLGLASDYFFGRHADTRPVFRFLYWVIPNWQHFWLSDALDHGGRVSVRYLAGAAVYGATYAAAVLAFGLAAFRRADMR